MYTFGPGVQVEGVGALQVCRRMASDSVWVPSEQSPAFWSRTWLPLASAITKASASHVSVDKKILMTSGLRSRS